MTDEAELRSCRDLKGWIEAMDLAVDGSHRTRPSPREEMFGRVAQVRRASASVPPTSRMATAGKGTGNDLRPLGIALGSLEELETHIIPADRVGLPANGAADGISRTADRVGRMLRALIRSPRPKTET